MDLMCSVGGKFKNRSVRSVKYVLELKESLAKKQLVKRSSQYNDSGRGDTGGDKTL